nr:sensor histidine kinase [Arthrobacter stackebrandtii]
MAVVAAVVLATAGTFAALSCQWAGEQAEARALAVARTVASSDDVRRETALLAAGPASALTPETLAGGVLQSDAETTRERTGALFVVITDDAGLRLAHPTPALLGQKVSTDPSVALAGGEVTSQEKGTLGRSARAKVPVYAPGSGGAAADVVGEVSVGFSSDDISAAVLANIVPLVLTAALSLALGVLASVLLGSRLRRLTLGLEPEEIAGLAQDQEAVLRGVDEGVIGVSANGTITVFNEGARRLLAPASTLQYGGLALADSGLPPFLADAAAAGGGEYGPAEHVLGDRVVIVSARAVRLDGNGGQGLGRVIMVRDRTEVQALTRQLDAVNALGTALRAQRHEFANRLHTVAGLLQIDRAEEAREYVSSLVANGPLQYPAADLAMLRDPYLEAFIGAKSIEAHERGVELRIGAETLIRGRITDPQDVTAVLGNLLDNAISAAVSGSSPSRWVEVELLDEEHADGGTLHIVVADSGDGLPRPVTTGPGGADGAAGSGAAEMRELVFTDGFSTAAHPPPTASAAAAAPPERRPDPAASLPGRSGSASGHGVGLALVRHLARRRGGDVWFADAGSPQSHGAVVCARLPGVVSPAAPAEERP